MVSLQISEESQSEESLKILIQKLQEAVIRGRQGEAINEHIKERYEKHLNKLKDLPSYHLKDHYSLLQWKVQLETMENKYLGLITQLIKVENEKPFERINTFPYIHWDDDKYKEFLDELLGKVWDILYDKNNYSIDQTPLTNLWKLTSKTNDPAIGRKLTSRLIAYYKVIADPNKNFLNFHLKSKYLDKLYYDDLQGFINKLDKKECHGFHITSCNRNVFRDICEQTYADAYEEWLADKLSPVPTIEDMMYRLRCHPDYPSTDKAYLKQTRRRINKVKREKANQSKKQSNAGSHSESSEGRRSQN